MEKFAEPLQKLKLITPADMRCLTEADLKTELGMIIGEYRAFLRKASELPNVDHWNQVSANMTCINIHDIIIYIISYLLINLYFLYVL